MVEKHGNIQYKDKIEQGKLQILFAKIERFSFSLLHFHANYDNSLYKTLKFHKKAKDSRTNIILNENKLVFIYQFDYLFKMFSITLHYKIFYVM